MKRINFLFAVVTAMLFLSGLAFSQSKYTQFGNLNNGSVTVTSAWTKLNTTAAAHKFTKSSKTTTIEVFLNSRFSLGSFAGGANGVVFQVRIDDTVVPGFENEGSLLPGDMSEFLAILAVFQNLPAGSHTVSVWAKTGSGTANSVVVDPGGWTGKMIVKETM